MKERMEYELRDPSMAALLRDAYADDPALTPAPGRTERIMRAVKAQGRRGISMIWASFAWGAGAMATAALLIALIMVMSKPDGSQIATGTSSPPKNITNPGNIGHRQIADGPKEDSHRVAAPSYAPTVKPDNHASEQNTAIIKQRQPKTIRQTPQPPRDTEPQVAPTPGSDEVMVASALYNVGTTAYNYGDNETAYSAFQDSYDTMPTPEAALGTGNVLIRMANEELARGSSGT